MAKQFNLTAVINAKLGNIRPVVQSVKRQLSGIRAQVDLKIAPNSITAVRRLNSELKNLNATLKQTAQDARSAASGMDALRNSAGSLSQLAKDVSQISNALKNTNKATAGASNQMEEFGRVSGLAIRRFAGFTVATGLVFGLVNAIGKGIDEAIAFDQQLVRIAQATNSTKDGMRSLSAEITRLSTTLGVSSSELVNVSLVLAQAGLSARDTKIALEALAKSSLTPTFTDMTNTVEGSIAAISQFKIGAKDLEAVLGSVNAVSAQFAVESDDIIAAIRRTGGVFAAASQGVSQGKDALNEFMAIFTSVRATTRESAETIATGLRTIFTRLQRGETIKNLQELGIQLTDAEGKFVGAYKAVDALAAGLKDLDPRDLRFSSIVEELGGFRQVSKVIPLIAQTEVRLKALQVAQRGQNSLSADAEKAQEALANKFAKVREEFLALIREISETSSFKVMVDTTLKLTSGLIQLASALKPIVPILATLGAIKLGGIATSFTTGLVRGARGGAGRHEGGYAPKFHGGGLVPGGKGTKDDYPATLQTGEFVIRQKAVDKIGVDTLHQLNRTGYAAGGIVNQKEVGAAIFNPEGDYKQSSFTITEADTPALKGKGSRTYEYIRQGLPTQARDNFQKAINKGLVNAINEGAVSLGGNGIKDDYSAQNLLKTIDAGSITGSLYEGILSAVNNDGVFDNASDTQRPMDFTNGFNHILAKQFNKLNNIKYIDAKVSANAAEPAELAAKTIGQLNLEAGFGKLSTQTKRTTNQEKAAAAAARAAEAKAQRIAKKAEKDERLRAKRQGLATGGAATGPGEVDAILTRGEFVINKQAANALGPQKLHALNNADKRPKFHTGGRVGFSKGQYVPSAATVGAVDTVLTSGKISTRQLEATIQQFQALGLSGKELDRATRVFAKELIAGKTSTQAYISAQNLVSKANQAIARKNSILISPGLSKAYSSGGLSGMAGYTARSAFGSVANSAKGFAGSLRDNPAAALGGIAIGAQLAGSYLDPKGTNSGIQGGLGALSGAAAGFATAGPLGGVVGGLVGGASGLANANTAKLNEEANKALQKSTTEVSHAFDEFVKSGSLEALDNAFSNLNNAQTLKAGASRSESAGIAGYIYGNLRVGALYGMDKEQGQDYGENLFSNVFGSAQDVESDKFRSRVNRYDQSAVETQGSADAAAKFFEKQFAAGKGVGDIANLKGGKNAIQAYLGSNLKSESDKGTFQQLQDNLYTAKTTGKGLESAQAAMDSFISRVFPDLAKPMAEQAAITQKVAIAASKANVQLERFYSRLDELSAGFTRLAQEADVGQQNLNDLADGGVSVKSSGSNSTKNIIENLGAYTAEEIKSVAGTLNGRLGNNSASRELTGNLVAAKTAKDDLPRILAELANANPLAGTDNAAGEALQKIVASLSANGASSEIIKNIETDFAAIVENNRKDGPAGPETINFLNGEIEKKLSEAFDKVIKVSAQAAETLDSSMKSYQSGLEQAVKLQLGANKLRSQAANIRTEGALKVRELRGEKISLADELAPFTDSIKRLTGGATNAGAISNNITDLENQKKAALANAKNSPTVEGMKAFSDEAANLEVAIQENKEALEKLSSDTSSLSAIQRRLADLESKKQQAAKSIEDLAFGNPQDQMEFARRAGGAANLLRGEAQTGPKLKESLETIREIGNILRAGGKINDSRVEELDNFRAGTIANNPFIKGIFGDLDVAGILGKPGSTKEEGALIEDYKTALENQALATQSLATIQFNTNGYLEQLNANLQYNTAGLQNLMATMSSRAPVGRNSGGVIPGRGHNVDTVPAMLTKGEFVVNRGATDQHRDLLEAINSGNFAGFADGGAVTNRAAMRANARRSRLGMGPRMGTSLLQRAYSSNSIFVGGQKLYLSDRGKFFSSLKDGTHNMTEKQLKTLRFGNLSRRQSRKLLGFNSGGAVGYNSGGSVGGGGQDFSLLASSAAQLERAANILANIRIPERIEMSGSHNVSVVINGAEAFSNMAEPIRNLVTMEINRAMRRHINPVTGETTGEYNG